MALRAIRRSFLLDIEPALLDYTQKPQEGLIRETKDYLVINERYLADEENHVVTGCRAACKA